MSLSDQNRALIERDGVFGVGFKYACPVSLDDLNRLLDAARAEGAPAAEGARPKRGDIRTVGGRRERFIESDDRGDVWEILPALSSRAAEAATTGYVQHLDEKRPARATGEWSDVWDKSSSPPAAEGKEDACVTCDTAGRCTFACDAEVVEQPRAIRIIDGERWRFVESDARGDVWELLPPAEAVEGGN